LPELVKATLKVLPVPIVVPAHIPKEMRKSALGCARTNLVKN
jgi:hypothetical protein